MYAPELTTAPTGAVVTVEDMAKWMRVDDFAEESDVITAMIESATVVLDGYSGILGRCLLTQSWTLKADKIQQVMRLPLAPLASVTSITITDADGTPVVVDAANYSKQADARGPFVRFKNDYSGPSSYAETQAVAIEFVAGYGTADAVPGPIKTAIKMMVAHWFNNREAVNVNGGGGEIPFGVSTIIAPYRRGLI